MLIGLELVLVPFVLVLVPFGSWHALLTRATTIANKDPVLYVFQTDLITQN